MKEGYLIDHRRIYAGMQRNHCGAYVLDSIPLVYRVHEDPDEEKLKEFNNFIHNFGYHLRMGTNIHQKELQDLLDKIKGSPQRM